MFGFGFWASGLSGFSGLGKKICFTQRGLYFHKKTFFCSAEHPFTTQVLRQLSYTGTFELPRTNFQILREITLLYLPYNYLKMISFFYNAKHKNVRLYIREIKMKSCHCHCQFSSKQISSSSQLKIVRNQQSFGYFSFGLHIGWN